MNWGASVPKVYPQMAGKPREFWDLGTPLNDAWLNWALPENRERYTENPAQKIIDDPSDQSPGRSLLHLVTSVASALDRPRRQIDLKRIMRLDLVQWLREEEFYALGFPVRPNPSRTPRYIPCEFWINAEVNWEKEIAEDTDIGFKRIRVVDPLEFPEFELKPKIGRKSHKTLIYQAIDRIQKLVSDFERKRTKEQIRLIREFIESENPQLDVYGKGFGDDAIRKHVKSYFREKNSN